MSWSWHPCGDSLSASTSNLERRSSSALILSSKQSLGVGYEKPDGAYGAEGFLDQSSARPAGLHIEAAGGRPGAQAFNLVRYYELNDAAGTF